MQRLYGRADAFERAGLALDRACAGRGQLILFTGEPGIGKSRVAEQVAGEVAARGAVVAWGRCWEAGGAPAYWPWIQVFRDLDMDEDPFVGAAADVAVGAAEARFAAFDRAVRALKVTAARRPLALVLDDLHAADAPSLLLLLLLARELPRAPVLVVGAYRDAETRLNPETGSLLAKIAREGEVVPLSRLSPEEVALWVQDAVAGPDVRGAAELYRVTEGHPLLLVEALRLGGAADAAARWTAGPAAVLDERLDRLSAAARAVLEVAAILGREFCISDVASTAGTVPDRVHEALREALATSIVEPRGDPDWFRFSHILLCDRLYAGLLPSARAELHLRAGESSLARGAGARAAVHHFFAGQTAGRSERIAEVALTAAEASLSRLAFEEAARLGRRALSLPDDGLPSRLESQLRLVVAESTIRLGEIAAGKALCLESAALAERTGADDLLARAALVYGTEFASGAVEAAMVALLRRALTRLGEGDSDLRARVMARLAAALTPPTSRDVLPEIVELTRAAHAMARRLGDGHTLLYVLQLGATVGSLVPEHERFSFLDEAIALARALDQPLVLLQTLPAYLTALLALGERTQAEATLPEYEELLATCRQPLHGVRSALVHSLLHALRGDLAEAERRSAEARSLAQRAGPGPGLALWLGHRLALAQLCGRPDMLAAVPAPLAARFESMHGTAAYLAWVLAGIGRRDEAARRLRQIDVAPHGTPSANLMELMGAAEAAVVLGERELGEALYPTLARATDRMFWNLGPGAMLGPTGRVLGDLALLIGRAPDAVRHYDEAIAFCERLGAPPLVESCRRLRQAALVEASSPSPRRAPGRHEPPRDEAPAARFELRREGEIWAVRSANGPVVRLKHSKGLAYLHCLLEQPSRQVHVLELAGIEHPTGDAGEVLDARAKTEYRRRLEDLREELAEAERFGDPNSREPFPAGDRGHRRAAGRSRRPRRSRPAGRLGRGTDAHQRPAPAQGRHRAHRGSGPDPRPVPRGGGQDRDVLRLRAALI